MKLQTSASLGRWLRASWMAPCMLSASTSPHSIILFLALVEHYTIIFRDSRIQRIFRAVYTEQYKSQHIPVGKRRRG